jgi:chromosome partitioning protein
VLVNGRSTVSEAIVPLRSKLEILPSNIDLSSAELELARLQNRGRRLKEVIEGLRNSYEYILIDCPPSIGILTVNALVASQVVIIPVTPSDLPIQSFSSVIKVVEALKDSLLLDLTIYSLITLFERRHREAQLQKRNLECTHGQYLLKTVVRKNTKLNAATRKGVPIFEYDPDCPGSRDYAALAEEIVSIEYGRNRAAENAVLRQSGFFALH